MTIAREEIFGPVLCILPYDSEEEAVQIANDTPYGLAAYVWSQDNARARRVGSRIRAGQVALNGASGDMKTPVRRLQDVGQRPRVRRIRPARLSGGQGRDRRRRRLIADSSWRPCGRRSAARESQQALSAAIGRRFSRAWISSCARGEYLAIMGESGVGKSTLLNLLAGLDRARRRPHRARRGGSIAARRRCATRCCAGVRWASCSRPFTCCPISRSEQNVALPLELLGVAKAARRARIAEMLAAVGICAPGRPVSARAVGRRNAARRDRARAGAPAAPGARGRADRQPRSAHRRRKRSRCCARRSRRMRAAGMLITHSRTAADTADRILVPRCPRTALRGAVRLSGRAAAAGLLSAWNALRSRSCANSRCASRSRCWRSRSASRSARRCIWSTRRRSSEFGSGGEAAGRRSRSRGARPARRLRRGAVRRSSPAIRRSRRQARCSSSRSPLPGRREPLKILGLDPFRAAALQPALIGELSRQGARSVRIRRRSS